MNDQELAEYLAKETGRVITQVAADRFEELSTVELGAAGDLAGHEYLVHTLAKHRPLDHLLSEEGEDNLGRLLANRVWIVDPLDGTSHYSNLEADYAVHIALWERDSDAKFKITASGISVPALDLIVGMNPAGPIADWVGPIRILVSATRPPIEIDVICEKLKIKFPERGEPKLIPMGSVGAKLTQILAGNADLYINTGGFYEWDIAAPAAIAAAHGLTACDIEGADLVFNQENVYVPTAIIGQPHLVSAITEVQR
jgi:3'(2'), 5'-bisphosphate nucleotidase